MMETRRTPINEKGSFIQAEMRDEYMMFKINTKDFKPSLLSFNMIKRPACKSVDFESNFELNKC